MSASLAVRHRIIMLRKQLGWRRGFSEG